MSGQCVVNKGSPGKPNVDEAVVPDEDAQSTVFTETDQESSSKIETSEFEFTCGGSEKITDSVIEEAGKLEEEREAESNEQFEKRKELWLHMEKETKEKRYKQLELLLAKSNMYTTYILKRIEHQKEEEKKRRANNLKKNAKDEKKEDTSKNQLNTDLSMEVKRRKTSGRLKLPAPVPKGKMSETSSSAGSQSSQDTPDEPLQDHTGASVEAPKLESEESQTGRKKRNRESTEQAPQGAKLLTRTSKPSSKKRKLEEDGCSDATSVEKCEKEVEVFKDPTVYDTDGSIIRPGLFTGGDLRKYQIEGLNWLKVLFENGINGILADEMGLGKTVQCIALLSFIITMKVRGPFIVVAPLSTLPNWKMEFQRFAPLLPVVYYHGNKEMRPNLAKQIRKKHKVTDNLTTEPIVITSYEIAMMDRPVLMNFNWMYMIVDEGHRIKNMNCRLIRELKMYKTSHRLLLTGTPLQNNLSELWSLLNFILPDIFDDLGSFETWFDVEVISDEAADEAIIEEERKSNILGMLHQILTPFVLRRMKTDVDLEIPPKKELIVYAPLTEVQLKLYESTLDKSIFEKYKNKEDEEEITEDLNSNERPKRGRKPVRKAEPEPVTNAVVSMTRHNILMQLRKACNHPYLLEYPLDEFDNYKMDEDLVKKSGKMMILDKMLPELRKRGHKVLIFSQMTKMLDILQDYMYIRNIDCCRLDGSCDVEDRQQSMEKFNKDPDIWVFLLSTRAGGLGVNLTSADTVIIYDSDWNPQCDLQAQDRCHRIGQTKPVVVYRFVTANTADQKITERAAGKRKLEKMVIHKGKFKSGINKSFTSEFKPLNLEELMELLKSKDYRGVVKKGQQGEVLSKDDLDALLDRSDLMEEFQKSKEKKKETQETNEREEK